MGAAALNPDPSPGGQWERAFNAGEQPHVRTGHAHAHTPSAQAALPRTRRPAVCKAPAPANGRAPARSTVPASFVSGPGWAHSRAPDSARLRVTAVAPKGWTHGCGKGNTFKQQKIPNGPFSLLAHIIAVSTLTRGLAAGWLNAASARAAASRGAPVAPWKPDPSGEEGGGGEGGGETHEIKSVSRNDRAPTRDHIIN